MQYIGISTLQLQIHFKEPIIKYSIQLHSRMYKALLVGTGGVGVMAAYALDLCSEVEVTAVIRSDYDIVLKDGYNITSVDYGKIEHFRPQNIVKTVEDAVEYGPFDYVVVSTKNTPDIFKVEDLIEAVVTPEHTRIVLLQNGIHIGEAFIEKYPNNIVLSGVSMISSTNYQAVISHEGTDALSIGYFNNCNISQDIQKEAALTFVKCYNNGKNKCSYDENVNYTRWRKLVYNATLNPICSLTGVDVGRLELFGANESMVLSAMAEVYAIAASDGVDIPPEVVDIMLRCDDDVYYAPSMLVDIKKGNYIEVEVIVGNAVRVAKKNGVSCPMLTLIYNLLQVIQKRTMEEKGRITVPEKRPSQDVRL